MTKIIEHSTEPATESSTTAFKPSKSLMLRSSLPLFSINGSFLDNLLHDTGFVDHGVNLFLSGKLVLEVHDALFRVIVIDSFGFIDIPNGLERGYGLALDFRALDAIEDGIFDLILDVGCELSHLLGRAFIIKLQQFIVLQVLQLCRL